MSADSLASDATKKKFVQSEAARSGRARTSGQEADLGIEPATDRLVRRSVHVRLLADTGTRIAIMRQRTGGIIQIESQGVRDSCLEAQRTDALELRHVGLGNNGFFVKLDGRPRVLACEARLDRQRPICDCAPLERRKPPPEDRGIGARRPCRASTGRVASRSRLLGRWCAVSPPWSAGLLRRAVRLATPCVRRQPAVPGSSQAFPARTSTLQARAECRRRDAF